MYVCMYVMHGPKMKVNICVYVHHVYMYVGSAWSQNDGIIYLHHVYVCMYVPAGLYVCMYVCMYLPVDICTHTSMCVCVLIYIYIYIYIYISCMDISLICAQISVYCVYIYIYISCIGTWKHAYHVLQYIQCRHNTYIHACMHASGCGRLDSSKLNIDSNACACIHMHTCIHTYVHTNMHT
jgi:hypothetical protein